jgi:hypothetical protein
MQVTVRELGGEEGDGICLDMVSSLEVDNDYCATRYVLNSSFGQFDQLLCSLIS